MRYLILSLAAGLLVPAALRADSPAATQTSQAATLRVTLPADARLTIDGEATRSTSSTRLFVSPPLAAGKVYFYTLRADYVRDGKPVSVERKVRVQPGTETAVSLGAQSGTASYTSYYPAPGWTVPNVSYSPYYDGGSYTPAWSGSSGANYPSLRPDPSDPFYPPGGREND